MSIFNHLLDRSNMNRFWAMRCNLAVGRGGAGVVFGDYAEVAALKKYLSYSFFGFL